MKEPKPRGGAARRRPGPLSVLGLLLVLAGISPLARAATPSVGLTLRFSVAIPTAPADIANLTATPIPADGDGTIQLSWTEPSTGAVGGQYFAGALSSYTILASTVGEIANDAAFSNPALFVKPLSAFTTTTILSMSGPGGTDTDLLKYLTPGVTYYFALVATNNLNPPLTSNWGRGGSGNQNNWAMSPNTAPPVPSSATATSLDTIVELAWSEPSAPWDLAGYHVWRTSGPVAVPGSFVEIAASTTTAYTDTGLTDGVTYYYAISAYNDGVPPMESALSQWTTGTPGIFSLPLSSFTATANASNESIVLQWGNPNAPPTQVLLLRNVGSAPPVGPTQFAIYTAGQLIGGATVAFVGSGNTFTDQPLALDATYYYTAYALTKGFYSTGLTTAAALDVGLMPPSGLDIEQSQTMGVAAAGAKKLDSGVGVSTVTITWQPVVARVNGTQLSTPPTALQLAAYKVYRSTSLWSAPNATWVLASSVTAFSDPAGAGQYYYVTAVNGFGSESPASLWIAGSTGDEYVTTWDKEFTLHISHAGVPALNAQHATIPSEWGGSEVGGAVMQAYNYAPYRTDNGVALPSTFSLPPGTANLQFFYQVVGQQIQFAPAAIPARAALQDASQISVYWYNGVTWFKLYGAVDTQTGSLSAQMPYFGKYQVRTLERSTEASFDPSTLTHKFLTPNGDGRNDTVEWAVSNPADVQITGKIFDLRGAHVADLPTINNECDQIQCIFQWDGKSNGHVVPSGVYIYQIQAGSKVFTGTVVVIK